MEHFKRQHQPSVGDTACENASCPGRTGGKVDVSSQRVSISQLPTNAIGTKQSSTKSQHRDVSSNGAFIETEGTRYTSESSTEGSHRAAFLGKPGRISRALLRHANLFGLKPVIFGLLHVACLGVFFTNVNVLALTLCGMVYFLQMVGITVGYHRYFAHRTYKTSRGFQFVLAWLGCSAAQRGPIWWVAHHRHHHCNSDTPEDLHSPVSHSLWQSHIGWVFSPGSRKTDMLAVKDLIRYPELRWLHRYDYVPPFALAALCFLLGSWPGLVWGFFISTVLSHHATFMVNSVCHLWGRRRIRLLTPAAIMFLWPYSHWARVGTTTTTIT